VRRAIIQLTIEVGHEEAANPNDVAYRISLVLLDAIRGRGLDEKLLDDVAIHGTQIRFSGTEAP